MASYDEDVSQNSFFLALQRRRPDLYCQAIQLNAVVLVPCQASLHSFSLSSCHFESYILQPNESSNTHFLSLNGKEVMVINNAVALAGTHQSSQPVRVLFEETFYTEQGGSFNVVCIASPLESTGHGVSRKLPPSRPRASIRSQPVLQNLEECCDFLWGTGTTRATRLEVDKRMAVFINSFRQLQNQSLWNCMDAVSAFYRKCLQIVLKDAHMKCLSKQEATMKLIRQAVEMYVLTAVYEHVFKVVGAIEANEDAAFNKRTRSLQDLTLRDLGITSDFSINIPRAKRELGTLNDHSTPREKQLCLRTVLHIVLQSPRHRANVQNATTDDLLPVLIYLVVKTEVPNWMANLSYMKNFQFSGESKDELDFCLTSLEASVEHVRAGIINPQVFEEVLHVVRPSFDSLCDHPAPSSIQLLYGHIAHGRVEEARMLLSSGEAIEDIQTSLCHPLCSCDSCERLVSGRFNDPSVVTPFSRDERGYTNLHIAAQFGQVGIVEMLIELGAIVNACDYNGGTPLHLACLRGHQDVSLLLLDFGANPSVEDMNGNTPLHLACQGGHEGCVKALTYCDKQHRINSGNERGDTPLHLASRWGYEAIVAVLLQNGADANFENRAGHTALACALNERVVEVMQHTVCLSNCSLTTDKDFEHQSDVATIDYSPTGSSRCSSCTSCTSVVLKDAPNSDEDDEKHHVVDKLLTAVADGDMPMVRFLLGWDEDDDDDDEPQEERAEDEERKRAGNCRKAEILCHPLCQCSACQPFQNNALLSPLGLSVNTKDQAGFGPLHVAVRHGHCELVALLLRRGARLQELTLGGATPTHLACEHGHEEVLKLLLAHGVKVNKQDCHGNTPLHLACAGGNTPIVEQLLKNGASMSMVNHKGNVPLHEATHSGNSATVNLLLTAGATTHYRNYLQLTAAESTQNEDVLAVLRKATVPCYDCELEGKSQQNSVVLENDVRMHVVDEDDFSVVTVSAASVMFDRQAVTSAVNGFTRDDSVNQVPVGHAKYGGRNANVISRNHQSNEVILTVDKRHKRIEGFGG
uniref:Ankyrin repeat domain 27 (VPS9 domain) n=1 Tax=Eptatretus burgeri TaxID=7764 RepID=A0A8C4X091_EPTBU